MESCKKKFYDSEQKVLQLGFRKDIWKWLKQDPKQKNFFQYKKQNDELVQGIQSDLLRAINTLNKKIRKLKNTQILLI